MFLQKLDTLEQSADIGFSHYLFNCDVEALYDSLKRETVILALRVAITKCRPDWSPVFIDWLIDSIKLSLDSAIANFEGHWYCSNDGVATGGKLCVFVANITVYYAFNEIVYSANTTELLFMARFIDDGTGCWSGTLQQFYRWFSKMYKLLYNNFNLRLTYNITRADQFIEFLDIKYRFIDGVLDTDINYKPTDAHRYLNFNSHHPTSTLRSIVYSQGIRLRRIIIEQNLLTFRLKEMGTFFKGSGFPISLVDEILGKVANLDRCLQYKDRNQECQNKIVVPWVSTFGPGDKELRKFVKEANSTLNMSPLFNAHSSQNPVVNVVTRRAANLKDMLFNQKQICLNNPCGSLTIRCTEPGDKNTGRPCEACDLMSGKSECMINNKVLKCAGGIVNPITYCIVPNVVNVAYLTLVKVYSSSLPE